GTGFGWGGSGDDGALDFDGTATFPGIATTTGSAPNRIYFLARDIVPTTIIVEASKIVVTNNYIITARTSATINGILANGGQTGANGNNASGATGGTASAQVQNNGAYLGSASGSVTRGTVG